jgi:predicted  nucleic acid-binding Zn-ribbon protein
MAFLWGAVVLASVLLNSYLSLPPIINMVQVDGPESVIEGVVSGDVALIASLINAFVAAVLIARAIIMFLFSTTGNANKSNEDAKLNGSASNEHIATSTSTSSWFSLQSFIILCVGLLLGYVLSNTLTVGHHIAVTTETMQTQLESAMGEVKSIQQQFQAATEDHQQCRVASADVQSELESKLAAKEAMMGRCDAAASDADGVRRELARVKADMSSIVATQQTEINRLKGEIKSRPASSGGGRGSSAELEAELASKVKLVGYLKREMAAMGESFGVKLGDAGNSLIDAQGDRRKLQIEEGKLRKEMEELRSEVDRVKRLNGGLERKLKKESEYHAATMDEYSRTVSQLKEAHDEIRRFLKEGNGEGLRRIVQ